MKPRDPWERLDPDEAKRIDVAGLVIRRPDFVLALFEIVNIPIVAINSVGIVRIAVDHEARLGP